MIRTVAQIVGAGGLAAYKAAGSIYQARPGPSPRTCHTRRWSLLAGWMRWDVIIPGDADLPAVEVDPARMDAPPLVWSISYRETARSAEAAADTGAHLTSDEAWRAFTAWRTAAGVDYHTATATQGDPWPRS